MWVVINFYSDKFFFTQPISKNKINFFFGLSRFLNCFFFFGKTMAIFVKCSVLDVAEVLNPLKYAPK